MSHNCQCPTYLVVLILLAVFGYAYNRIIASLESQGHDRGYMGFIVALGCLATIDGWRLAIRTGPADFNKVIAAMPRLGGIMPTDLRMVECALWRNGQQLATPTEESFFAALRIPCWPPSERSAAVIAKYLESRAPTLGTILISLRKEQ